MTAKPFRLFQLVFLLLICLLSGHLLWQEAGVFFRPDSRSNAFFEEAAASGTAVDLSAYSQKLLLGDCHYGLTSVRALAQPKARIEGLAGRCRTVATTSVQGMPTHSFAWLVLAEASAWMGDMPAMRRAYLMSGATGRNEQWMAEMRVELAENHFATVDSEMRKQHEQDLAMLVRSTRGIFAIARRYLDSPDFHDRIVRIVETLPASQQERFLSAIKRVTPAQPES